MISWNKTWMNIAEEISKRSKDPNTKVGAVIVKGKHLLSLGYNGAPSSFPDYSIPFNQNETDDTPILRRKNTYMVHAELNAILNYSGKLSDLNGSTIYVTLSPCPECAKTLAQVGVNRVIYKNDYHRKEIDDAGKYILNKCDIEIEKFNNE